MFVTLLSPFPRSFLLLQFTEGDFLSAVVLAGSLAPPVAFGYRGGWDPGEATAGVLV
jgi:hypothetical protein